MKNVLRFALGFALSGAMYLPVASMAAGIPGLSGCTDIPTTTTNVPAPGSGSFTVGPLTKFGLPATACVNMGTPSFSGTNISMSYDYTTTLATSYNKAKFPSSCAGIEYELNGGPVYSAVSGKGAFAYTGGTVSGSLSATAFTQTENLTLTAAGSSFVINTGLLSMKSTVTINADGSTDVKICTPKGGVQSTVNGSSFTIPTNVWKCLAEPTSTQKNVRVTYEEGC